MKTKTKISLAVASAFGVSLITAGAVLLAIFPLRNAIATPPEVQLSAVNETTDQIIDGFNDVKMTETPDERLESKYVFSVTATESEKKADPRLETLPSPFEMLRTKIQTRLGYGPEFAMLKSINLTPEIDTNLSDGDTEGFYIPLTYEIFVGMQPMLRALETYGFIKATHSENSRHIASYAIVRPANQDLFTTYATYADVLSEKAFQIVYHEYGHHIANVYLNTDNRADDSKGGELAPISIVRKNRTTGAAVELDQKWDHNFYQTFVDTLGYSGTFTNPVSADEWWQSYYYDTAYVKKLNGGYQYEPRTNFPPDVGYTTDAGVQILPLSNLYSLKDLFDKANANVQVEGKNGQLRTANSLEDLYPELTANPKIGYAPFGPQRSFSLNKVGGSTLNYLYSMEELFARKMMQATMPLHATADTVAGARYGYLIDGSIRPTSGGFSRYASTFLGDTLMSQDDVYDPTIIPTVQRPFYHDFLFADKIRANTPIHEYGNEHAKALYDALIDRMGFTSGDDISHVWWKNEFKIDVKINLANVPDKRSTEIKFGGYVSPADLKTTAEELDKAKYYLTYLANDQTRMLIPVTIKKFTYFLKPTLLARAGQDYTENNDKYFYVLDQYVQTTGNESILNKPLALVKGQTTTKGITIDLPNAYQLRTINRKASTDVRAWTDYTAVPWANFTAAGSIYPILNNDENAVITLALTKIGG